ncbi:MAG: hypothetical protein P1S60_18285, partial [Anaerolineae bacterium]|nr:hypothetical protein [Anaerolineae bacterium]
MQEDVPPTVTPIDTPLLMCTAPACAADEVYYCEDECLGGCGTTCATITPTATTTADATPEQITPTATATETPQVTAPPVISWFKADKSSITQGESLNVSWSSIGGDSANIQYFGSDWTMLGVDNIPPDGGSITITPYNGPVILNITNNAGTTSQNLSLTILCAYAWVPELQSSKSGTCPMQAEIGWAAQQPFQNGFMIWLEPSKSIVVFFNNYGGQSYRIFPDTFKDGDPETDPNFAPPSGLLQPKRGFGKVWRENIVVRDNLGWATADESGFETWRQSYQGMGMHNVRTWMKDI